MAKKEVQNKVFEKINKRKGPAFWHDGMSFTKNNVWSL